MPVDIFGDSCKSFQQSPKAFLRVSIVPLCLLLTVAFGGHLMMSADVLWPPQPWQELLLLSLNMLILSLLAVGLHRFIALGEEPKLFAPHLTKIYLKAFIYTVLHVILVAFIAVILAIIVTAVFVLIGDATGLYDPGEQLVNSDTTLLNLVSVFVLGWIWYRFSAVLVGVSTGQRISLLGSWRGSKQFRRQIVAVSVVCVVLPTYFLNEGLPNFQQYSLTIPIYQAVGFWIFAVISNTVTSVLFLEIAGVRKAQAADVFR